MPSSSVGNRIERAKSLQNEDWCKVQSEIIFETKKQKELIHTSSTDKSIYIKTTNFN